MVSSHSRKGRCQLVVVEANRAARLASAQAQTALAQAQTSLVHQYTVQTLGKTLDLPLAHNTNV